MSNPNSITNENNECSKILKEQINEEIYRIINKCKFKKLADDLNTELLKTSKKFVHDTIVSIASRKYHKAKPETKRKF